MQYSTDRYRDRHQTCCQIVIDHTAVEVERGLIGRRAVVAKLSAQHRRQFLIASEAANGLRGRHFQRLDVLARAHTRIDHSGRHHAQPAPRQQLQQIVELVAGHTAHQLAVLVDGRGFVGEVGDEVRLEAAVGRADAVRLRAHANHIESAVRLSGAVPTQPALAGGQTEQRAADGIELSHVMNACAHSFIGV